MTLEKGKYYLFRLVWTNFGGPGWFKFKIPAPDGTVVIDDKTTSCPYLVRFGCNERIKLLCPKNATLNPDAYFDSPGWHGVSLSLIVLNVLNRDPPYVMNSTALYPVNYDPTNANPLGRFVALALRKKW